MVSLARSPGEEGYLSLQPGTIIGGKYCVERVLGEGGMGIVYAAHHQLLDQSVALKVLFEEAMRDKEASARFLQEARSAARLQSEHVARVMDIDTLPNGVPYIVMEYLEGADLGHHIENNHFFTPEEAVDFVLQALEAIAQAHAQGIVHRDLKPSNLFLATVPDGSQIIKVLDFGISKPTFGGNVTSLTSSRSVLGSPPYMSPEQVRSPRSVDPRTDIWSIGVLLYELLTGRMPFEGEQVGELFAAILEQEARGIRVQRPDVPEGLERAIFCALAKKRDQRYANVSELAKAIAPFGSGAQSKSVEKISSTLLRREALSSPRRRSNLASSGITSVARDEPEPAASGIFDNTTVPDPSVPRAVVSSRAPELSPTASTVVRRRPALSSKIVAPVGGGLAAVAILLVTFFVANRSPGAVAAAAPVETQPVPGPAPTPANDVHADPNVATPVASAASDAPAGSAPVAATAPTTKLVAPKPVIRPLAKTTPARIPPAASTPKPADDEVKKTLDVWN